MRIGAVELVQIRCYEGADMRLSAKITLLAGENNSGKSTIIRALNTLQGGGIGPESVRLGSANGLVRVRLDEIDSGLFPPQMRGAIAPFNGHAAQVQLALNSNPQQATLTIALPNGTAGFHQFSNTQPENLIVPYFSERRTSGYGPEVGESVAFAASGTLYNVSAKIERVNSSRQLRPLYEEACEKVLGFVVTTFPQGNGMMAGLEIDGRARKYIPIAQLGAGVSQALGLIVEMLVATGKVFLVEEIENDLHPTALRALLDLVELAADQGNQFVISTHSNVVLRRLGSVPGTRVWRTARVHGPLPPKSELHEVPNEPTARRTLLQSLGYDLSDYDLYDAWLILEESSAEAIIREFIIPLFAPGLTGRLRTVAAQGAGDVEPRFTDLHRLFVFTHLAQVYRNRAWVIVDGDQAGTDAINKLKEKFRGWPAQHFQQFKEHAFERYYPKQFGDRVSAVLSIGDDGTRRQEKAKLTTEVVEWLRANREQGTQALSQTADEVIVRLRGIEQLVTGKEIG